MNPLKSSRFIRFLGGRDFIFFLLFLILIGIVIFVYNKISFIFHPVIVILSTVGPPIVLAFIAFYLLNPVISILERLKIKRIWGIILIILGIIGLVTTLILVSAPAVQAQLEELTEEFPQYISKTSDGLKDWLDGSFLSSYYDNAYDWVTSTLSDLPSMVGKSLSSATENIGDIASKITNIVVALVTFPLILFFLLKDSQQFRQYSMKLLPPRFRNDTKHILANIDTQVGSYIQGQIIVATCIGILLYIGYLIIGLDYAITLAIVAAITSVVPYLGPMIAISPAIIIALVHSPFMLLKLAIVWAAVQLLEGNFISPNVMGRTMRIHPLTIILTLLVAGNLFGVVGVILGIPGYAILKVFVQYVFDKFKSRYNRYYGDSLGEYERDD